jgi:CHAT domain-containing protein
MKPPGPLTGGLASALLGLAKIELQAGNIAGAEEAAAEARGVANKHDLNQVWQIERVAALAAAADGKTGRAQAHFDAALNALEAAGERLRPEEFRLRFGVDRLGIYDECASLLAAAAAKSGRTRDTEAAFGVLERRRRQALWDILSTGWAGLVPEAMPEQIRAVRLAEEELAARQSVLRAQFALPPEKRNHRLVSSLQSDLEKFKDEHARLLIGLAQGKYRYASPGRVPDGLGGAVCRALSRGRALVEFLVGDEVSYAFVATASGLHVVELAAGREDLRRDVASLLQPFYRLRTGGLDVTRIEYDFGLAESLYRRLLAPLEKWLAGTDRIFIVPDDVLCYLPFEALVDKRPEAGRRSSVLFAEHQAASFLLHRYTFSYLAAAGHIVPQGLEKARPVEGWTLLALANPVAAPNSRSSGREDPFLRQLRSSNIAAAFSPLPGADSEVGKIRRYFPVGGVTVVSGRQATEEAYRSMAGRYDIVHLATHAVAADDQAFYSTLILATGPEGREDGFLQAYEILRIPLRARLVVLSACETALGPVGRGEGMVGLVSAFRQAGAGAVLATQWSIDESAAELMDVFYKAMAAGKDMSRALRQAKLEILKKRLRLGSVELSLAHPFFWAPFVLIGGTD